MTDILYAAFKLPVSVAVEARCLGLQVASRFGQAKVEVLVPEDQADDPVLDTDDAEVATARSSGVAGATAGASRTVVAAWDQPEQSVTSEGTCELRRLLLRVTGPRDDLAAPRRGVGADLQSRLSDELFRVGNSWFDTFRSWIEVVTMQDLDHLHPRWTAHFEGAGIATFGPTGERLGHGGIMRLDSVWPDPADRALVASAIRFAGEGERPPLAHQILRDARAAHQRGSAKRAIIDAATAAEIALTRVAEDAQAEPRQKNPTLGVLVRHLHEAQVLDSKEAGDLKRLVVDPRNAAIHRGQAPSAWDAAEGCKAAQIQVWKAFHLGAALGWACP